MKRWLLAGTLALAASGQAVASDLPPPPTSAPPRAPAAYVPPPSPVYNWGGIYFGFNLGYGFGTSVWNDPTDPGGTTGNFNLRGFLSGVTVGANFQTDGFVFGAEADFDGSWIDGKVSSPFCSTGTQCETKNFWFSTLRGRLGYAADRVLFYGTAGGALGDVALGQGGSFQHIVKGRWTAGAGLEAAFTEDLTARIEPPAPARPRAVATSASPAVPQTRAIPRNSPPTSFGSASTTNSADLTWKFVDRWRALSNKHSG